MVRLLGGAYYCRFWARCALRRALRARGRAAMVMGLSPSRASCLSLPRQRLQVLLCCHAVVLLCTLLRAGSAITAPNTSLELGTPVCYFGGNAAERGPANIAMLAKMRMVMIEKWEGTCWQDCLASNNSKPPAAACLPGCDVEDTIVGTLKAVKAVNPSVSGVLCTCWPPPCIVCGAARSPLMCTGLTPCFSPWISHGADFAADLNTLLDFPFYALHGRYLREGVVAMDSVTRRPIQIRNDNGMEGIFVFGFDSTQGQELYIDAVRNLTCRDAAEFLFFNSPVTENRLRSDSRINGSCS
jgi:hypothetical protein